MYNEFESIRFVVYLLANINTLYFFFLLVFVWYFMICSFHLKVKSEQHILNDLPIKLYLLLLYFNTEFITCFSCIQWPNGMLVRERSLVTVWWGDFLVTNWSEFGVPPQNPSRNLVHPSTPRGSNLKSATPAVIYNPQNQGQTWGGSAKGANLRGGLNMVWRVC